MVESRIKPYYQQVAERTARQRQQRVYRRNQVFGLMLVAAAIFGVWLVRTNPAWVFPPEWWRPCVLRGRRMAAAPRLSRWRF